VLPFFFFFLFFFFSGSSEFFSPGSYFMNFVKKMAQELTHRTIQDGWFREISDTMWPGQAMALRVKKILHVEQSKYQDVSGFITLLN
jgi:hypothetical protein